MNDRFDFVIIGGGSAGCVLANRLSENPAHQVLLIEAGGTGRSPLIRIPLGMALTVPGHASNWNFSTTPQPGLNGRRGFQPRGKGLGGSSAINAMIYTRGHPDDYNDWAAQGLSDFRWEQTLPWFTRGEANGRLTGAYHGTEGELSVSDLRYDNPVVKAFSTAAGQLGIPVSDDFNQADQEGVGRYQVTQRQGLRCSAAAAYLHPVMHRPNLTVLTQTRCTRLEVGTSRVEGVWAMTGNGPQQLWRARQSVILSAGAFQSPQLLLLSGIGPKDELSRHGIPLKHELSGVGDNLQDHLDYISSWRSPSPHLVGYGALGMARIALDAPNFLFRRRGIITSNIAEAGGFVKTDPALSRPDVQLHFLVALADDHNRKLHYGQGLSVHACQLRPYSRGQVGLHSRNPLAPPRIDPAFLSDDRDLDCLLRGVKLSRDIMMQSAMAPYRGKPMFIRDNASDDELVDSIRNRADTIYHPVGTCRMGTDPDAVVDQRFRLNGLDGLRVVDASVMPTLIGGNTNAPTLMLANRAAHWILNSE
ncbi:MAG: GMC family oxidoreductase [Saccharospirillum sp.]